jgi:Lar family restriction alleviation protein
MSEQSKTFWQDYQKRNGTIDVPELLDLYAAAKDAEIEKRGGCIIEMGAERALLLAEVKRLREGIGEANAALFPFTSSIRSAKNMLKVLLSPAEPEPPTKALDDQKGIWIGDISNSFDKWLRILKKEGEITIREDGGEAFKIQKVGGGYESKSFESYDLNDVIDWMSTRAGLEFFYPNKDGLDENGLLPCPFCGGKAEIHYQLHDLGDYAVKCSNCGCEPCPWGLRVSKAEAIEDWNRRAGKEAGA